jgi:putative transcriptional regulator
MPQLDDPNFRRSVVLLCEHSAEGAWGLVVNRPTGKEAAEVLELEPPVTRPGRLELYAGGPVEPYRGCMLLGEAAPGSDAIRLSDGLYLSASSTLLRRLLEGPERPSRARLLVGYAGWGPGQLDEELRRSAWLISDVELDIVFDVEAELAWETAIRRMGADPAALQMSPGVQ